MTDPRLSRCRLWLRASIQSHHARVLSIFDRAHGDKLFVANSRNPFSLEDWGIRAALLKRSHYARIILPFVKRGGRFEIRLYCRWEGLTKGCKFGRESCGSTPESLGPKIIKRKEKKHRFFRNVECYSPLTCSSSLLPPSCPLC